jgi:RND family efflux transporter MFP subunit
MAEKSPRKGMSRWVIGIIIIVVLAIIYVAFARGHKSAYQFIKVTQGPITETVSVTGNTTPIQSVSLGFQNTGTIAAVYHNLGDTVTQGQVIARLDTATNAASIQEAQAAVDQQNASLASLEQGTLPQQIALDQAAVTNDQTALANAIQSTYIQVQDAVQNKIYPFFNTVNANKEPVTLNSSYDNLFNSISQIISPWGTEVNTATSGSSVTLAQSSDTYLSSLIPLIDQVSAAVTTQTSNSNYSADTIQTLQSQITAARLTITSSKTSIDTAEAALTTAQGTLSLAQAGATPDAIAAQQAQVEQAQASLANAEAVLQSSEIVAPISGILTQQDAKVGQLATVGTPLVSVLGANGFEVDAGVSETDVGKLAVGDPVNMTLDAFPNETFAGSVFYIAPAETDTQGVITYLVKVSFDKPDPRIKSGLTANLDIQTNFKPNVLVLPEYAILQNDNGTFVEVLQGKTVQDVPVTLGIQDQNGNVEVTSGVSAGEQVLNVGLKT